MPAHIHAKKIYQGNAHEGQGAGINESSADAADHEIVSNQKIRLAENSKNPLKNFSGRLQDQTSRHKVKGDGRKQKKALPSGQLDRGTVGIIFQV